MFEPAAEQVQHRGHVVFGDTTGIKKEIDASAELIRTPVSAKDIVQRRAGILPLRFGAVRIGSVFQEPFYWRRLYRLARREENREIPVPFGVHVRSVRRKQLHHGDAMAEKRSAH